MRYFPQVVTFRVTSRCNNDCKYCFGPRNVGEMNLAKLKKLFRLFYSKSIKAVVLTGGEPLLRDDFGEIIDELRKYNFKIFLDTNGDYFFKYKDLISNNIDELALPVDFPDRSYRNKNNLKTILRILNHFKTTDRRPMIRIGTVATKENIGVLDKVGELLKDYPVDIWKIYQFIPENFNALRNRRLLEVSQKEFDKSTRKLREVFSKFFKLVIHKRDNMNRAYFFVGSDGTVFMPVDDGDIFREKIIGNIFDGNIFDKWEQVVSEKNYLSNIKATFNI